MTKPRSRWDAPGVVERLKTLYTEGTSYRVIAETLVKEFPGSGFTYESVRQRLRRSDYFGKRKRQAPAPTTAATIDTEGQIAGLRADLRELTGANRALKQRNGELQSIRDLVIKAARPLAPHPARYKVRPKTRSEHPANLLVGDWHIGEVIEDEASGGWGAYDFSVARRRVEMLGDKLLSWVEVQRSGFRIDSLNVFVVGDMVAGDIHEGLRRTNEFPTPVAACRAGHLLADLVGGLAPHFSTIELHIVGVDNHGRLTVKPQFKRGALNNWSVVVSEIATADLRRHENVHPHYHVANPALIRVVDSNVLVMHGAQIKSWMNLPYYGLDRYRGKKAISHMRRGERIELMICGHFHTFALLPGWLMNGCLPGTGELDNAAGRFSPPSQTSFLWHREHGMFNVTPWNLEEKKEVPK